jgi:hypothetical protein
MSDFVKKFNLKWVRWGNAITLLGKRGSGKTFMMKELIRYFEADLNIVFAGSDGSYMEFCEITNPLFVYDAFSNVDIVEKVLLDLMALVRNKTAPRPRKILVLFDDLGCEEDVMKSKILLSLYARGRHLNLIDGQEMGVTVVIAIQQAKMIGPKIRDNTDFLFCHALPSISSLRIVWSEYTTIPSFPVFSKIYEDLHNEKDYASLVINNLNGASRQKRSLTWYCANKDPQCGYTGAAEVNDLATRFYDSGFTREVSIPAITPPASSKNSRSRSGKNSQRTKFAEDPDLSD